MGTLEKASGTLVLVVFLSMTVLRPLVRNPALAGAGFEELDTLEAVVAETEDEQPIPPRCPQEYCDAAWTERTILGVKSGRYALLDDGKQVQCLECESIHSLDRVE